MDQILQWFEANAGKIIFLLVAIVAALLITKGLARVMRKVLDRTDMPSASIFINIMRVLVWILAASIVLQPVFGISPTTLMTALGVGGIAVSLGLKDTVANVISGFGLMLGKVIQPGDLVSVAGTAGVVKDITWRQTVVRERNGNEMVIPNSVLNTASLEKLTPSNEGCVTMTFTAKAGIDPDQMEQDIIAAVEKPRPPPNSRNPAVNHSSSSPVFRRTASRCRRWRSRATACSCPPCATPWPAR